MIQETLFDANGQDHTRIKRAFRWVVTFRDFPAGSYQTVKGDAMMTEALTLFTKGRAAFYLDGVQRGDRLPGILSSEHELVGLDGQFTLKYLEPTTRVCIPASVNGNELPTVLKFNLEPNQKLEINSGFQGLVCLGAIKINDRKFVEEQSFKTAQRTSLLALEKTILLEFK